ncbi:MAG TPA: glycoside hydrolase family 15 protein [Rhizomicrobium sp.]|nr:glycoside hydrolase family 15 protein [Rhizomicrobium sp.]
MPGRIEDYAVIGNCETVALVGLDGSIDWLCIPRFDRQACFAALLGDKRNGRWLIAPENDQRRISRRYVDDTLILETTFDTPDGRVQLTDFMFRRDHVSDVVRLVKGLEGNVKMQIEIIVRFDYGSHVPWVVQDDETRLQMISGPDRLILHSPVKLREEDKCWVGEFDVSAGEEIAFSLSRNLSYRAAPEPLNTAAALRRVKHFWKDWTEPFKPEGEWAEAVLRSLITLKALSHWETGGIVAAGTTSLPEQLGGSRNWDYRYCWLRDATFTLYALIETGFLEEAKRWREWLLRACAGGPEELQPMYGVAGERRLDEFEVPWLAGYENSLPVRIGNAAASQVQLDVYGEVLDAMYAARKAGLKADMPSWSLECAMLKHLEEIWTEPDEGIWEVRGRRQHFTHSKVMAWVAFDRAVRTAHEFGREAPLERWTAIRDRIHEEVCERGFDAEKNSFVQYYGSKQLDGALLMIPLVGFLPATDPRVRGTVAAIERELLHDGFVRRYDTTHEADGLPPGEGVFLACSFWLVDNYVLQARYDDARNLFKRLLSLRNDVGLLAEEYDPIIKRQVGNFPQAFSHLALINSARNLTAFYGPAEKRAAGAEVHDHEHMAHPEVVGAVGS